MWTASIVGADTGLKTLGKRKEKYNERLPGKNDQRIQRVKEQI